MVGVTHGFVVHGVGTGIDSRRQSGLPGGAVERVLHRAASGLTGADERLRLAVVVEVGHGHGGGGHHGYATRDGELGGLRAAVVALTCHGDGGSANVRVVSIGHGVVSAFGQDDRTVLHGHGGLLGGAVVDERLRIERQRERGGGISSGDGPLCCSLSCEVALGLGRHGGGVGACGGLLVARHVVVGGGNGQFASLHAHCAHRLLRLVIDEAGLAQRHAGQRGLGDGHIDGCGSHVVVVLVARHLIIYGVCSGIGLRRNTLAVVRAVGRIEHLSALGAASLDESLGRGVKDESRLRGRSGHAGVGLRDGEGSLLCAAVVAHTRGDDLGGTGVHVVLVGQRVVGVLRQDGGTVLHSDGGLLLRAVIDERGRVERQGERRGILSRNAPLCRCCAGEVAFGLGSHGGGVVVNVGLHVARHVVVGGAHVQRSGLHAADGHGLLRACVGQRRLGERHGGQHGLGDGHLDGCGSHVAVVGVARCLVIYGVRSGVGSRWDCLAVGRAVERVEHGGALGAALVHQLLCRGVIRQVGLSRWSGHGGGSLRDGELCRSRACVVALSLGRHGHGVGVCGGLHVARHIVVGCGNVQFTGLHAAHADGLLRASVGQAGLGERHGSELCLGDGEVGGLLACVVALSGYGHGGLAGIHVVRVGHGVVRACNQDGLAVLHSNGWLLLRAVVGIGGGAERHVKAAGAGLGDGELLRQRALEVVASCGHGHGVRSGCGLGVAAHAVVGGGHVQFAGLHAGDAGRLSRLVIDEAGGVERHGAERGLLDGEGGLLRAAVVALARCGHLGRSGVHVVLEGQRVVGVLRQDGRTVLHSDGGRLGRAVIDERGRVHSHSKRGGTSCGDAPLCRC